MNNHEITCTNLGIDVKKKRYRRYYKAGLLDDLDEAYADEVKKYWLDYYDKEVDPILHLALYNLTGIKDVRIAPGSEMWNDFIPYFNDRNMVTGYKDKNIYDKLFETKNAPRIYLKRVRGHYYNTENEEVSFNEAEKILVNRGPINYIVKPSTSNNGVGIELLQYKENNLWLNDEVIGLTDLENLYGYNFMVQEVVKQHPIMKNPHPSSVNTLRMVTLRWNNKIEYLLTFARFGADNSVKDNAGAGGVVVGVKDNGEFLDFGIDEETNFHKKHPTTGYVFSEMPPIPNFNEHIQFIKDLHKEAIHLDFISWDIAVGENAEPIFIEANFAGATPLYQLSTGMPIFREFTEEVLQHVNKNWQIERDVGKGISTYRKEIKQLKRTNKKIRRTNKKLEKENEVANQAIESTKSKLKRKKKKNTKLKKVSSDYEQYNKDLKNSTSWKLTAPLRKVKGKLKKK